MTEQKIIRKNAKGAGRPKTMKDGRNRNLYLPDAVFEKAKGIGSGSASQGFVIMTDAYLMSSQIQETKSGHTDEMYSKFISSVSYIEMISTKNGTKGLVKLSFYGEPMKEFWLSSKQAMHLQRLVDQMDSNHSTKDIELHAVFKKNEGGTEYYVWAGLHSVTKSDLAYLEDKFNLPKIKPDRIKRKEDLMTSEVHPLLKDD